MNVAHEIFETLSSWGPLDTWIVVIGALAAMACALVGNFLILRRQSMMGDALSHTALLGIVVGFLFAVMLRDAGWISGETYAATRHLAVFVGAMIVGVLSALLAEVVQKLGRVEASAALGAVFTTVFAAGLLGLRLYADDVDLDPDCVLYGTIETAFMNQYGNTGIPSAAIVTGVTFVVNAILVVLLLKELRITAFDPALASTMGISSRLMHYGLMAVTAVTLVAAFETVGSILVIAMLIVPPATAHLLTDRLGSMILVSLVVAALSAALGHVLAITVPSIIFSRLGFETVVDASTAGMMAVASGLLFVSAMLFGPRHGILSKVMRQAALALRIASEDLLGSLYRWNEQQVPGEPGMSPPRRLGAGRLIGALAVLKLRSSGLITASASGYELTDLGHRAAEDLVRSHRLWESYMARHFELPDDHLHVAAEQVEHFLGSDLREQIAAELDRPRVDPHGRSIPGKPE